MRPFKHGCGPCAHATIVVAGKRYTLVPEETIPSKAKSVKSLTSFAKRSAQLAAGFVCAIALAAGVPTVAGAQVLTTDNVCGKTADARGITAENLPDIDATNALVMGKDGTVYYGRGADEQVKIASITKVMTLYLTFEALESGKVKLTDTLTVSYKGREFDVRGVPGVMVGEKLHVTYSPWQAGHVSIVQHDAQGNELLLAVPEIEFNEAGFPSNAAVFGEEFKRPADTVLQTNAKLLERLAMGEDTDTAAAAGSSEAQGQAAAGQALLNRQAQVHAELGL